MRRKVQWLIPVFALSLLIDPAAAHAQAADHLVDPAVTADPPNQTDTASEPTWMLVGIGAGLFFAEYLGELVLTAATGGSSAELERAAIPVAGPWLELASGEPHEWWEVALTVYEGVMQIAGLALIGVGLAWQRPTGAREGETISVAPTAFAGGGGVSLVGGF